MKKLMNSGHLWESEIDGDCLWYVEEPGVAGQGDGEAIHGLEDMGPLVLLKHVHGQATAQWAASQAGPWTC